MKAILEFNMDDPHDRELHNLMVHAEHWYMLVYDLDKWVRTEIKYSAAIEPVINVLEGLSEMLHLWMENSGISLNDLS